MKTLGIIVFTIAIILFIDFVGLCSWIYSGQRPADNFYVGRISAVVISSALNAK